MRTIPGMFRQSTVDKVNRPVPEENYMLHSLTSQSLLSITMQAGLSALKTPMCYQESNKSLNCPVCTPKMGELAQELPFSHRIHSCLVCRVSNVIMNEDNPPWCCQTVTCTAERRSQRWPKWTATSRVRVHEIRTDCRRRVKCL